MLGSGAAHLASHWGSSLRCRGSRQFLCCHQSSIKRSDEMLYFSGSVAMPMMGGEKRSAAVGHLDAGCVTMKQSIVGFFSPLSHAPSLMLALQFGFPVL